MIKKRSHCENRMQQSNTNAEKFNFDRIHKIYGLWSSVQNIFENNKIEKSSPNILGDLEYDLDPGAGWAGDGVCICIATSHHYTGHLPQCIGNKNIVYRNEHDCEARESCHPLSSYYVVNCSMRLLIFSSFGKNFSMMHAVWIMTSFISGDYFNSLAPGRYGCNFELLIFKTISSIDSLIISSEISLRWMPKELTAD